MAIDESSEDYTRSRVHLSMCARWAIGAGFALLVGLTALWAWWIADQPVRWRDVGFAIVSPTEATATYDVFLYNDAPVTCHLHALNVRFAEVGVATVSVSPDDGEAQRITTTIITTESATTAVVNYCEPSE